VTRFYEDIGEGEHFPLGSHTFTEDEILRFGRTYDPQYFHTDPEAAKHSHFGGLVASGWHTVSVGHRKLVDAIEVEDERLRSIGEEPAPPGPSPGVNKMEFKVPVRPGDTVTYDYVLDSKRRSNSIPGWGLLFQTVTGVNQRDEIVYRANLVGFSKLRDFKMPLRLRIAMALTQLPFVRRLVRR
jgi:acyl dehydratase